ncbi:hypothetical protein P8X24_11000 [Pyrococcus kukulkanii]|uniref:hypothetical protein n=1 Tax=Pyrococcus kukulkanii TaxID=1609559 RepID=UPI00356AE5D4
MKVDTRQLLNLLTGVVERERGSYGADIEAVDLLLFSKGIEEKRTIPEALDSIDQLRKYEKQYDVPILRITDQSVEEVGQNGVSWLLRKLDRAGLGRFGVIIGDEVVRYPKLKITTDSGIISRILRSSRVRGDGYMSSVIMRNLRWFLDRRKVYRGFI